MYIVLIVIHIIVCAILIATILLQAGKGGGLTEAFSGSDSMQSVLGTQAPTVLKKATQISAIAFLITSLALGMVTARRGRSLFERMQLPVMPVTEQEEATTEEVTTSAEETVAGSVVPIANETSTETIVQPEAAESEAGTSGEY